MKETERLKIFRKSLNLTQIQFCKTLGLQQGSYSDIERGKSFPTFKTIKDLIQKHQLNPLWLFTGLGDMRLDDKSVNFAMEDAAQYGQRDSEVTLLLQQINSLKGENEALKKLVALYEAKN